MTVSDSAKNEKPTVPSETPVCGLVMPISSIDGCDEAHWKDVKSILTTAIVEAGFEANLVSNDTDVGVIHKRIVQNLYTNPVVVCDVSGKNPNVMFELGMRLAFDKPVVIVKDDKTPYSFDTSPVEHLTYPRDLRFGAILEFQARLKEKVSFASTGKNSFLSSFGTFKVAQIKEESASALEIVLEELSGLKSELRRTEERRNRDAVSDRNRLIHRMTSAHDSIEVSLSVLGKPIDREEFFNSLELENVGKVTSRRVIKPDLEHCRIRSRSEIPLDLFMLRIDSLRKNVETTIIEIERG